MKLQHFNKKVIFKKLRKPPLEKWSVQMGIARCGAGGEGVVHVQMGVIH